MLVLRSMGAVRHSPDVRDIVEEEIRGAFGDGTRVFVPQEFVKFGNLEEIEDALTALVKQNRLSPEILITCTLGHGVWAGALTDRPGEVIACRVCGEEIAPDNGYVSLRFRVTPRWAALLERASKKASAPAR